MFFHAKDDPVEVRREVFKVLLRHEVRFSAVVKCKWPVLAYVRSRNRTDVGYRYHPNELYDFGLRRLFKQRLHRHHAYRVVFAIRGNRERTAEFRQALESARDAVATGRQIDSKAALEVVALRPAHEAALEIEGHQRGGGIRGLAGELVGIARGRCRGRCRPDVCRERLRPVVEQCGGGTPHLSSGLMNLNASPATRPPARSATR